MPLFVEVNPEIVVSLTDGGKRMVTRQVVLHTGSWAHPTAPGGKLEINEKRLDEIIRNFNNRVGLAGPEMPAHIGHTEDKDDRAVAWTHKLEKVADPNKPGHFNLVAMASHTDPATFDKVKRHEYRYVSPTLVFNYKDRNTGKTHDTVMRNYAYTNYPFLQGMGDAEVLNLSEVKLAESRLALTAIGGSSPNPTVDATGAAQNGNPNTDNLPSGYDIEGLPKQCSSCARLGGDCPFSAGNSKADLALKTAAAASGNCPQYIEADNNIPGGGGAADQANQSPINNRASLREPKRPNATRPKIGTSYMKSNIDAIRLRLAEYENASHQEFITSLAEGAGLTADTVKEIEFLFKTGTHNSTRLSEGIDELETGLAEVKLSDGNAVVLPSVFTTVNLDETVTIEKKVLRDVLTAVAKGERIEVKLGDTTIVTGRPGTGDKDLLAKLGEQKDPKLAAKMLDEAHASGLC